VTTTIVSLAQRLLSIDFNSWTRWSLPRISLV